MRSERAAARGATIRARRKALRLSQAQLAAAIGMPGGQPYISALERGKQDNLEEDTLGRLAAALGLEVQVLMSGERIETDPPVDMLRAVGWAEPQIARFLRGWHGVGPEARARQYQRVLAMYAQHQALEDDLDRIAPAQEGAEPIGGNSGELPAHGG